MSWPSRVGMGVAILAALAAGRAIDVSLPQTDDRPFVHDGAVGERVHLAYADITVDDVRSATTLTTGLDNVGTPGRWLVVDVTVVAWGRPLHTPGVSLHDANGRTFRSDPRSGYTWTTAPTGVPWHVCIPFEVPEDALEGATLTFSRNPTDDRRDDVARIDLGIESGDVAQLWETNETIEVHQPETGTL